MSDVQFFSVDDVNALIPRLELLIERAQRAALALRAAMPDAEHGAVPPLAEVLRDRPELAAHARDLEAAVDGIEALGGVFKGLDLGLVDFPTRLDGTVVLLCWQYGEKRVAYWHPSDEGFAGRRLLAAAERPELQ
jgi:hypothetical protein